MLVFLSTDLFSERMGQAVESRSATRFCSVQLFNCVYIRNWTIRQIKCSFLRRIKTLPIVSKNIAHHFGKHCPSFQKTLPVIFPAVAHRFEKTWATKMQKKGRHRKNGSAPSYVFLRKCEPVALLFISNHGSSTTDLYPALCHGSFCTSPSHRRCHPVSRHTDGTSALPPG